MAAETRRTRNARGQGARLRDDIVGAAGALLDETGDASAVTLRAVARRAGIAAPSIYAHFTDPRAILLAVVEGEFDALTRDLGAAVDAAGAEPVRRLRAWCAAYLDGARARPRRYLVMFGGVWDARPAVADAVIEAQDVSDLGRAALDDLTGLLRACVDAGTSGSTDPAADAMALWVALHGLAHQRIVSTALHWPEGIEERLIRDLAHLRGDDTDAR